MSCAICDCTAGPSASESFCEICGHDTSVHHVSSSMPVGPTPQSVTPTASTVRDGTWWFALGVVILVMVLGYYFSSRRGSSNKNPQPTPQTQQPSPGAIGRTAGATIAGCKRRSTGHGRKPDEPGRILC